ncbi:MAG TPA: ABC transporter substrate-binding protein [Pseudomonadota bacterium]|nr:ABC transporter substrate-binding protein [Pseudomonadota bacterium]
MKERAIRTAALPLAACLAIACSSGASLDANLAIGAVIDRTGPRATASWSQAVKLAADLGNRGLRGSSSFGGVRFEIALADSASDPSLAVPRAQDLVRESGIKGLITDSSEDDIALHMLAYDSSPDNDLNVPIVCMACTSGSINSPTATSSDPVRQAALRNSNRWNFRSLMSSNPQANVLLQVATSRSAPGAVAGDV